MTRDELLAWCLELPGAWPDEPWESDVVAKVGTAPGRIFAFPGEEAVALKADPVDVVELRAAHPGSVGDAPYLSRQHWVRVAYGGSVGDDELRELAEQSYRLVVAKLPRSQRPPQP
jgi:predicted DNA-binding protein (MmcQ/YjbR family)